MTSSFTALCICLALFHSVPVTAVELERTWPTVPVTDVVVSYRLDQPGLPYFRILNTIGEDVYIGSNETLVKLTIVNNTVVETKRTLVTAAPVQVIGCDMRPEFNVVIDCWNFIRVAEATSTGDLLVCGSNAANGICYACLTDLSYCNPVHNSSSITLGPEIGTTHSSTALFKYGDKDVLYDAAIRIDTKATDGLFTRYSIGDITTNRPILKERDTFSLSAAFINDPTFVGRPFQYSSSDGNSYVFILYRETALEYNGRNAVEYSRIARVCQNDTGNAQNTDNFITFIKARLQCSIPDNTQSYFYNDIQDMVFINDEVYAVFTTKEVGPQASALCRFRMEDIMNIFDNGLVVGGSSTGEFGTCEGQAVPISPNDVLMARLVPNYNPLEPTGGFQTPGVPTGLRVSDTPTLYVSGVRFTSLAIDLDNCVYFFGTSDGTVIKVHKVDCQDVTEQFTAVEFNELGTTGSVTGLEIVTQSATRHLVITTDHTIVVLALNTECSAQSQRECDILRFPYCEWKGDSCGCTNSDCEDVAPTPAPGTELLRVHPLMNITSCYNDDVYWYCHLDTGNAFVEQTEFNLTWNYPFSNDTYNPLLVKQEIITPDILELKVTVRSSTVGAYSCSAMLGDGTTLQQVVQLTMRACETSQTLQDRCDEYERLKAESDSLDSSGFRDEGNTCSVSRESCTTCPP